MRSSHIWTIRRPKQRPGCTNWPTIRSLKWLMQRCPEMREYARVHSTFWSSPTIAALSDDGKLLALYLMTCSHNTIAGVFRIPDGYISEDIGWTSERVSKGLCELFDNGFANRCETTKWVWLINHLKWNKPENPNQRKAAAKVVASIPSECCWKPDFMRFCAPAIGLANIEEANPYGTVTEPFRNQEQEQEQEQEREVAQPATPPAAQPSPSKVDRGRRIPDDWKPTPEERQWAADQRPDLSIGLEVEKFRDYWRAKTGQSATKRDWSATWRNWVRNANARPNGQDHERPRTRKML